MSIRPVLFFFFVLTFDDEWIVLTFRWLSEMHELECRVTGVWNSTWAVDKVFCCSGCESLARGLSNSFGSSLNHGHSLISFCMLKGDIIKSGLWVSSNPVSNFGSVYSSGNSSNSSVDFYASISLLSAARGVCWVCWLRFAKRLFINIYS